MPTKQKRTALTLPQELDDVLTDIANLKDTQKTKVITEFLMECLPQFIVIRDSLVAIKENESVDFESFMSKMLGDSFQNLADAFKSIEE